MSEKHRISVLVVDDHQMFAQAVASALEGEGDIDVVGIANCIQAAREHLDERSVDVVLMDQRLPDGRGTQAVAGLRAVHPSAKFLMLSAGVDDGVLKEAIRVGCLGYVNKAESIEYLVAAVRSAHAGATSISPRLLDRLVDGGGAPALVGKLTSRELTIVALMVDGLSSEDICERSHISPNTLRNHVQNIIGKLGAHSKLEAVLVAIREGLVAAPEAEDAL